jgi:uncharacterized protein (TIGR02996 family)
VSSAIEQAFFERIRDEPEDDSPRLIYADWLDENGQPERAEFIRLQCALERLPEDSPSRAELRERERQLAEANEARWSAQISPLVSGLYFRRGVIDSVAADARQFLKNGPAIFDLAPVRKVRFVSVGESLPTLVQSPLLQLIRELDFSENALGNRGPVLLAKSRHLTRLDALNLSFTALGDKGLQALATSPAFERLRSLKINDNTRLGIPGIRALAESPFLTALTDLDVSGNGLSDVALRPLFDGPPGSRLFRLNVVGNRLRDAGTAALVAAPVFRQMAERDGFIDLRRVEMGPEGAKALAASPALARVERLDLEGNVLGDAGLTALAASPHLTQLRELLLRDNRLTDYGIRALSRSPVMATLRVLDLTENVITQESQDRLNEASVKYDWRGPLKLIVNSHLRTRPAGGYFRRLSS